MNRYNFSSNYEATSNEGLPKEIEIGSKWRGISFDDLYTIDAFDKESNKYVATSLKYGPHCYISKRSLFKMFRRIE